jgi:hypothetical protein
LEPVNVVPGCNELRPDSVRWFKVDPRSRFQHASVNEVRNRLGELGVNVEVVDHRHVVNVDRNEVGEIVFGQDREEGPTQVVWKVAPGENVVNHVSNHFRTEHSNMSDFDAIDALLHTPNKPPRDIFPWENNFGGEDHVQPELIIGKAYEHAGLNKPRYSWAPSPAAMYTAINMLRQIQSGQRHKFIEGLVPAQDIEGSAQRTVLDAIIDRTVTTTMGGCVKTMLDFSWRPVLPMWPTDLRGFLHSHHFIPQSFGPFPNPPSVNEVTVYPAEMMYGYALSLNVLSFVPYIHLCWFCLPPVETRVNDDNRLEFMRFRDGYTISIRHEEALPEAQPDTELPTLTGEVQEPQQRLVMFAMCALNKHEQCGGQIVHPVVVTTCSCECHKYH